MSFQQNEDAYIATVAASAVGSIEASTLRYLRSTTLDLFLDCFPSSGIINVPRAPLVSITSVKYIDDDGAEQTLAGTEYSVDTSGICGRVLLGYGKSWPSTRVQANAVTVRAVVGYATADSVPPQLLAAAKLMLSHLFENREPVVTGTIATALPMSVEYLIAPYKVHVV